MYSRGIKQPVGASRPSSGRLVFCTASIAINTLHVHSTTFTRSTSTPNNNTGYNITAYQQREIHPSSTCLPPSRKFRSQSHSRSTATALSCKLAETQTRSARRQQDMTSHALSRAMPPLRSSHLEQAMFFRHQDAVCSYAAADTVVSAATDFRTTVHFVKPYQANFAMRPMIFPP
jgi:hypothetical protein